MALTDKDQQTLLKLAREVISCAARQQTLPLLSLGGYSLDLQQDGASFVTLTRGGDLRGCIGSLEPRRPLVVDVRENAISAAMRDPRFMPVNAEEVDDLHIEISVLSEPEPLLYQGSDDLMAKLRPGVDGVVIEASVNRATFLPQVWEKLPEPTQFLEQLCRKAYLPPDAYKHPGLNVYTYQVDKFEEEA